MVTLQNGVLRVAFDRNIDYLNHCIKSPLIAMVKAGPHGCPPANEARMLSRCSKRALRWEEERKDMRLIVDTVLAR